MGTKWHSTVFPGVRYREHKIRKHGVKFDRYFAIRYQKDGKRREEALGWVSEGWTIEKVALQLAELKKGNVDGGPKRLSEKREQVKKQEAAKKVKAKQESMDQATFGKIFTDTYFPSAKREKSFRSYDRERGLFDNWLKSVIGKSKLNDIAPIHIEKIKKNMRDAGRAPRSIVYALTLVRQVFNFAIDHNLYNGTNNALTAIRKSIKKLNKADNRRSRFLTANEADSLLEALKIRSQEVWEHALISLHTGIRASEIFRLKWVDINLAQGLINIKSYANTKSENRYAYMTTDVKSMFSKKSKGRPNDLIYKTPDGEVLSEISNTFGRVVKEIGLNDGISDRRDKLVFHSLRHTYASWLAQEGESLYVIQERMGHKTFTMTQRYAHLAPENAQGTVKTIEKVFRKRKKKGKVVPLEDRDA